MAGTKEGGRKAAAKNLAADPNFYRRIGAIGGRNGRTGGFAEAIPCTCDQFNRRHLKRQCAGSKGGIVSRRRKAVPQNEVVVD